MRVRWKLEGGKYTKMAGRVQEICGKGACERGVGGIQANAEKLDVRINLATTTRAYQPLATVPAALAILCDEIQFNPVLEHNLNPGAL